MLKMGNRFLLQMAGFAIILIIWQWGSVIYQPIIVPSIPRTIARLCRILYFENGFSHIGVTVLRTGVGFALVMVFGILAGVMAGHCRYFRYIFSPFERVAISVPPIVWIILILIWFGGSGVVSPALTVFMAQFPMVYLSASHAVRTLDKNLFDMARSFNMSPVRIIFNIGAMHILSNVYPVMAATFGASWKITVMAEVLGSSNGIGAQISRARVNLETADVFAWVIVIVALYILSDRILIGPINQYTMKWR